MAQGVGLNSSNPCLDTLKVTSKAHKLKLFHRLANLQKEEHFCDITIKVDKELFHLHRNIIAAASGYFRNLLLRSDGNTDKRECIEIPGSPTVAQMFSLAVELIYTGTIEIRDDLVLPDLFQFALFLDMESLKEFCEVAIEESVRLENCQSYHRLAVEYGLKRLLASSEFCIAENFSRLSTSSSNFLDDLKLESLCNILKLDVLDCQDEFYLYKMVTDQLAKRKCSKDEAIRILQHIRFGLIPLHVNKMILTDSIYFKNRDQAHFVKRAITFQKDVMQQPLLAGRFCHPRAKPSLVIVAGSENNMRYAPGNEDYCKDYVQVYDLKRNAMRNVDVPQSLPEKRFFAYSAVCNNFLYVIGGSSSVTNNGFGEHFNTFVENSCYRYSCLDNQWLAMAPILHARRTATAFCLSEAIYIVGGFTPEEHALKSVEKYNIDKNTWKWNGDFPIAVVGASSCVIGDTAYVCGGRGANTYDHKPKTMFTLTSKGNTWATKGCILFGRSHHGMATDGHFIYIAGGYGNNWESIDKLERFDPKTGQSTELQLMCQAKSATGLVYHAGYLYMAGGYNKEPSDSILIYDIKANTWMESDTKVTSPILNCTTDLLYLPHQW